jgi:hypothetical protein
MTRDRSPPDFALALPLVLAASLAAQEAAAFTTIYDCANRWPEGAPATYHVTDSVSSLGDVAGSLEELREVYRRAFDVWSAPCCSDFAAAEIGTTPATGLANDDGINALTIVTDEWPRALGDPTSTIGVTLIAIDEDCRIVSGDVLFNAAGFRFSNRDDGDPIDFGSIDFETIAVHELGHFLGLGHTSIEGAAMFPAYPGRAQRALEADDQAGVCTLYPRPCACGARDPCPAGFHCVEGLCELTPPPPLECPPDPDCPVCARCNDDADCGPGGVCLPAGFISDDALCTRTCSGSEDCPEGTDCFVIPGDEDAQLCFNSDAAQRGACPADFVCGGASRCDGDEPDAGPIGSVIPDAGGEPVPGGTDVGCGCRAGTSGVGAPWLAGALLALVATRRRAAA